MTISQKILAYIYSRKTPATHQQIVKRLKCNPNTARKELGQLIREGWLWGAKVGRKPMVYGVQGSVG